MKLGTVLIFYIFLIAIPTNACAFISTIIGSAIGTDNVLESHERNKLKYPRKRGFILQGAGMDISLELKQNEYHFTEFCDAIDNEGDYDTKCNIINIFESLVAANKFNALKLLVAEYPELLAGLKNPPQELKNVSIYSALYIDNINAEDVKHYCDDLLCEVEFLKEPFRSKIISLMGCETKQKYEDLL